MSDNGFKPVLKERYETHVVEQLKKQFGYDNMMRVPRIEKLVVNMGVGDARDDSKLVDAAAADLATITGQKPSVRRAKKSIANFKLREGMPIGCMVTLRGDRMWEFLYRLVHVALPRIRDFQGIPDRSFDGRGNYSLGLREQIIFPEIDMDKIAKTRGMDITFVTTAQSDDEARALLRELGLPFRRPHGESGAGSTLSANSDAEDAPVAEAPVADAATADAATADAATADAATADAPVEEAVSAE